MQVADCSRLVVHAMSNSGHMLWMDLLKYHLAEVQGRLAAVVFDCGPAAAPHMHGTARGQVLHKTIAAAAIAFGCPMTPTLNKGSALDLISATIDATRTRTDSVQVALDSDALHRHAALEPPVPLLVLTSAEDVVLPEASVRATVEMFRAAQPSRSIRIEVLKGSHCQLVMSDRAAYRAHIDSFLSETLSHRT